MLSTPQEATRVASLPTQHELELEMHRMGVNRYRSGLSRAREVGAETRTAAGRRLLQEAVAATAKVMRPWLKGRTSHTAKQYLQLVGLDRCVLIGVKAVLDGVAKGFTLTSISIFIGSRIEDEARFQRMAKSNKEAFRQSERWYSGAGKKFRRRRQIKDEKIFWDDDPWTPWPKRDKLRIGLSIIEHLIQETGLVRIEPRRKNGKRTTNYLVASDACLKWLEESHEYHEALYPVYLPCVVPPRPWDSSWGGGYLTDQILRRPFVKTSDRNYLESLDKAEMPTVYAAVNAIQNTAWEVNLEVLEVLLHFRETGVPIAGLPERDDDPLPPRPENIDNDKHVRGAYARAVAACRRGNESRRSHRLSLSKLLFSAEKFAIEGARIWFPHKVDFRGRAYPIPSFLQPQGSSISRGLLRFADGLPLEDEASVRWFYIQGANTWGEDKVPFSERVAWVKRNHARILQVHQDPIAHIWWSEADRPWEFLAWCLEYGDFVEDREGFLSHLPVAQDGSNNGLQIFSLLLRDRVGGESTNCTYGEAPRDIYQDVADLATETLRNDARNGHPWAQHWLDFGGGSLPRKATKRPVMVLPYGGTRFACTRYLRDWLLEEIGEVTNLPWDAKDGFRPTRYLSEIVWSSIHATVIGARACMEWLQQVIGIAVDAGVTPRWTSPSGFLVQQSYFKFRTKSIVTTLGDRVRRSSLREDTTDPDRKKHVNGISPNYVHSLDAAAMSATVQAAAAEGIRSFSMVHDSFATHAARSEDLARILREQYAEMFKADLLEEFRVQIQQQLPEGVELPPPPEYGDLNPRELISAPYFFA